MLVLLACTTPGDAALWGKLFRTPRNPPLAPMDAPIDPFQAMGTWYVQRQIPALSFLEAGARNGKEQYTWDETNGRLDVQYTLNRKGKPDDDVTTVRQRGWVGEGEGGSTRWQVSPKLGMFYLPFRLPFIIIDVVPDSYMVCSGGINSWMYVMTRERHPGDEVIEACLAKVQAAGFDMNKVLVMEHG